MVQLSVITSSLAAVVVLLLLSAFFSSSESAIFSLPDEWAPTESDGGGKETLLLEELRSDPHRLLVTLLVGNNIVNIALTSIVTLVVAGVAPPGLAVIVSTLIVSVLVLVFGEIVPKSYGLAQAQSWSLRVARPVRYAELMLSPLVIVFDSITGRLTSVVGGDLGIEETYLGD